MKHYLKSVLLLLLLATTTVACMQEIDTEGVSGNNDPEVTFMFELPAQAKPGTRATTATLNENQIDNVYVLAFDKNSEFSYYRPVTTIENVDNGNDAKPKKKFKVSLIKSADANDKYSFVLIANVKDDTKVQIKALTEGTTMATALAGLTYTTTTNVVPAIPMTSLPTTPAEINSSTTFAEIDLTRMAARIDVSISAVNYRVAKVNLYNYNTCGWAYAPESAFDKSGTPQTHVQTPTINNTSNRGFTQGADNPISISNGTDKTVINFTNKLYTFEAVNADNSPCLVVELEKTTDGGTTYSSCGHYKLTFAKAVSGSVTPLDILRNYRYIFNINSVNSEGFTDPKDAYNSVITGLEADVIDWSDAEVPVVATDGNGLILAVNKMEFEFSKEEASAVDMSDLTSLLKVYTNNASGWTIEELKVYNENKVEITEAANKWFAPSVMTGSKNNEGEHTKVFLKRLKENTTGKPRQATFKVVAGNIEINITVTQTAVSSLGVPYLLTATNSSSYMNGSTYKFQLNSTGNWRVTKYSVPNGTTISVGGNELKVGSTGSGSNTPEDVILTAGDTPGDVTITFICTNGYFSNGDEDNQYKVTLKFRIVTMITYTSHNGWAGSNIYWDGNKLTFADKGTTDKQGYQGVFFRFGSLIGLDPTNSNWSSTTSTVYAPKEWSGKESILLTGYNWNQIPYLDVPHTSDMARHSLLENHDPSAGKGDICKYITDQGWAPGANDSPRVRWRMATQIEFGVDIMWKKIDGTYPMFNKVDGTAIHTGFTEISAQAINGYTKIRLPRSRFRKGDGAFDTENAALYYTATSYWYFMSSSTSMYMTAYYTNKVAGPVRCVRE